MRKALLLASFAFSTLILCAAVSGACSSDTPKIGSGNDSGPPDARLPYPSFRDDVAPIIAASCALTACHGSRESPSGLFLTYDPKQILPELQKTSPTAMGEKFVVPGDPAKSYLVVKLEGRQGDLAAKCPDPDGGPPCGASMPQDTKLPDDKLATIRAWITAGAKDN